MLCCASKTGALLLLLEGVRRDDYPEVHQNTSVNLKY